MLDYLQSLDAQLLLAINGMHNAWLDTFMWHISKTYSYAGIALVALIIAWRRGWKNGLVFTIAIALAVLCADQIASTLIKENVQRLRPTHNEALMAMVHIVRDYRGGMYGFVSSHAANAFAVAVFVGLVMPNRVAFGSLLAWAVLQCYSRMYLGVHYPGDILGGTIVGILVALVVYRSWRLTVARYCGEVMTPYDNRDSWLIAAMVWVTIAVVAVVALF
ncbi:MAG: phosphatase PAP2 family protein [Bacteroidales bacterium]|nr:phosphatase PAP2 family protein [Candidatus Sodaliphilus fimicaballi]